jgi:hypothetical protein
MLAAQTMTIINKSALVLCRSGVKRHPMMPESDIPTMNAA